MLGSRYRVSDSLISIVMLCFACGAVRADDAIGFRVGGWSARWNAASPEKLGEHASSNIDYSIQPAFVKEGAGFCRVGKLSIGLEFLSTALFSKPFADELEKGKLRDERMDMLRAVLAWSVGHDNGVMATEYQQGVFVGQGEALEEMEVRGETFEAGQNFNWRTTYKSARLAWFRGEDDEIEAGKLLPGLGLRIVDYAIPTANAIGIVTDSASVFNAGVFDTRFHAYLVEIRASNRYAMRRPSGYFVNGAAGIGYAVASSALLKRVESDNIFSITEAELEAGYDLLFNRTFLFSIGGRVIWDDFRIEESMDGTSREVNASDLFFGGFGSLSMVF